MSTARRGRPPVKAQRLEAQLRRRIEGGEWRPGDLLPTEHQLSATYGVSRMCLRSALAALESAGLVSRQRGKGTFVAPDLQAAVPSAGSGLHLAVLLNVGQHEEELSYHDQIARGIRQAVENEGCALSFHGLNDGQTLLDFLRSQAQSGAHWEGLLTLSGLVDSEGLAQLAAQGIPLVGLSKAPASMAFSSVEIDNQAGGAMAMRHLLASGCRRPLILDSSPRSPFAAARQQGIRQALQEAGLSIPEAHFATLPSLRGHQAQDQAAALVEPFLRAAAIDAVFVYMEQPTIGVYRAITAQGLRVGEDIAVIHYNDYPWLCDVLRPQPTAVRQPFDLVARDAAKMLLAQMRERRPRIETRVVQPQLMLRASCPQRSGAQPASSFSS